MGALGEKMSWTFVLNPHLSGATGESGDWNPTNPNTPYRRESTRSMTSTTILVDLSFDFSCCTFNWQYSGLSSRITESPCRLLPRGDFSASRIGLAAAYRLSVS